MKLPIFDWSDPKKLKCHIVQPTISYYEKQEIFGTE